MIFYRIIQFFVYQSYDRIRISQYGSADTENSNTQIKYTEIIQGRNDPLNLHSDPWFPIRTLPVQVQNSKASFPDKNLRQNSW